MSRPGPGEGVLGLLLLLGVALHFALRIDYGVRNLEYAPNMVESPGYAAHDENPNFADGSTLRRPPPGTVARGFAPLQVDGIPLNVDVEWEDMPKTDRDRWDRFRPEAEFESLDPDARKAVLARGAEVFANVCAVCHGPSGTGGSPVVQRGLPLPTSLLDAKLKPYTDGHLFHVITFGRGAITPGKGNMAAHRNHVARADRWSVIRYVRKLQEASQ